MQEKLLDKIITSRVLERAGVIIICLALIFILWKYMTNDSQHLANAIERQTEVISKLSSAINNLDANQRNQFEMLKILLKK